MIVPVLVGFGVLVGVPTLVLAGMMFAAARDRSDLASLRRHRRARRAIAAVCPRREDGVVFVHRCRHGHPHLDVVESFRCQQP